jgi:Flp pilus assembly pilin Flp
MTRLFGLFNWPAHRRRRAVTRMARRLLRDERGGEVLEYALVVGLIVVGAIATITCVGTKMLTRWNSVDSNV